MKKVLSLLLAVCLCAGLVFPAFADTESSEVVSKLILTAKGTLGISDEEFVFTDYYQNETETGKRYNLNWESKDETSSSSISVEIGEDETIYRYRFYDSTKEYGQLKYPKYTEAEALAAAKKFFAKVDAAKAEEVSNEKITYEPYESAYIYSAQRVHGDIEVFGNAVSIQIEADSLKPTYYYTNWNEQLQFAESEGIPFEQAAQAYREKLGYELFYQVVAEDNQDTVKLVYRPKYDETLYVDAESGEAVDLEQLYDAVSGGGSMMQTSKNEAAADAAVRLSAEEQAMVDEIAEMLSKKKAEELARVVAEFDITSDYEVESYNIRKDLHGKYIGHISFRMGSAKEGEYGYRSVTIDVKTGEITSFSGYSYSEEKSVESSSGKKAELTEEKTKQIAERFLEKYYAEKFTKMEEKTTFKPQSGSAIYQRVENGVKFYNNGASISVDSETKKIRSFRLDWTEAELPEVSKAAGLEKAYEKLLTEDNFRCGYFTVYDEEGKNPATRLVYRLENELVLDAESLAELDWRLRPVEETQKPSYTDLEGHYAKNAAEKLLVMGIYYPGDELRPNEAVTQREYLGLVAQVVFQRTEMDDDEFYNYMLRRGVLDKVDIRPDSAITRVDGIRYLLNALGYKDFAAIPGIFNCPFADVAEKDKGYGAIAAGLKLVYSETDTFYANDNLKRGDSLIIMYNYISR